MNLKQYLIENNITYIKDVKDLYIKDELNKILLSNIYPNIKNTISLIEYIKRDCNVTCLCGKPATWDNNNKKFRTHCLRCKDTSKIKEIIKKNREDEIIYTGDFLNLDDLINLLKNIDLKKYLGSGKQRTFIKEYNKEYHSILHHTTILNNIKNISLRARIIYLLETPKLNCEKCESVIQFNNESLKFNKFCSKCTPKFGSKEYFKEQKGVLWKTYYNDERQQRKQRGKGLHTKEWYEKKYGLEEGNIKYKHHINRMLTGDKNHTGISKVSVKLFNEIITRNPIFESAFFGVNEQVIIVPDIYSNMTSKIFFKPDFLYENSIIEFQGDYWHKDKADEDLIRKTILENMGYRVLFIFENEYNQDPEREVEKCIRFLEGCNVNDRYLIQTSNGYEQFDGIVSKGIKDRLKINFKDSFIIVSTDHKFIVNNLEIIANNLKSNDFLEDSNKELKEIISIEVLEEGEVFDILNTESHSYIANDTNNHNCEFLGSSTTLIDSYVLRNLPVREPIKFKKEGIHGIRVYEEARPGRNYVLGIDAAKDGLDYFAFNIIDVTTIPFKQVLSANLQMNYLDLALPLFNIATEYNEAFVIIENNEGAGQSLADMLWFTYEYENLYSDPGKKHKGYRTTTRTRKLMLTQLKALIESDNLQIFDKESQEEFFHFLEIKGKFQADEGYHDDLVMSLGICVSFLNDVRSFEDMGKYVEMLQKGRKREVEDDDNPDTDTGKDVYLKDLLKIGAFEARGDDDYVNPYVQDYFNTGSGLDEYNGSGFGSDDSEYDGNKRYSGY